MNKRRQIADSNPKNLTHFSGNSMSSSINNGHSPINTSHANPEYRPTKSIIIGAGQPIVMPGQQINLSAETKHNLNQVKPNLSPSLSTALSITNNESTTRTSLLSEQPPQNRSNTTDHKVTSVEEFCPDGGTLDKGFLDDLPTVSNADVRQTEFNCDSDSDSNETGNPLVAKFHDDPFDDLSVIKNPVKLQSATSGQSGVKIEPKVNPLAKNKNKGFISTDLGLILSSKRRSSNSSEDIEIPNILKTKANDNISTDLSNEEFDSWLSDTNQRRSPEGGEDEASLPSIDKTINDSIASISTEAIKMDRLQLNDGDEENEKYPKEKSSKCKEKKKKKEKKDKKEKKERGDKDKKRSKSKKSHADDLLSENKESLNHSDRQDAEEDQYEAL